MINALVRRLAAMERYFFDTRDGLEVIVDDVGTEADDMTAVKAIAALSLAELARDVLPVSWKRCLGVDVRDQRQMLVLTTELTFEARVLV